MIIIRDTREKDGHGWVFPERGAIDGTIIEKLDTGDYSIKGFEDKFCIERKGCVSEWANNVTQARFIKELERMRGMRAFILLEFDVGELLAFPPPHLKRRGVRVTGAFILKKTMEFQAEYGVNIMFVGTHGKEVAKQIFSSFKDKLA